MALKFVKDNLPWIVPSVAIALAASGFFDRSENDVNTQVASAPAELTAPTPQPAAAPVAAPLPVAQVPAPQPEDADLVARQATAPVGGLQTPSTLQTEDASLAVLQPAIQAPVIEPAPQPEQQAAYTSTDNAAAFFNSAQASIAAQNSCKEDLRTLTNQATVYFPSGGLTPDVSGIEQARLIGLVAQNCPGVRIQVEGHSDPSGNPATNLRLSSQRAESIIQRIGASGIGTENFVAQGFGDRRPSGTIGPNSRAYYDRRVEFSVIETVSNPVTASYSTGTQQTGWQQAACVGQLESAVASTKLFYSPRSVAIRPGDLDRVVQLASLAANCPQARLRVIGMHADELGSGEDPATGRLRAKALMTMLVGRGITPTQIIIAAPSRNIDVPGQPGLSGSRVDFDVILEEG